MVSVPPTTAYGQPTTAYGQPTTAYGQPTTAYGQPTTAYGLPRVVIAAPASGHGKTTLTIGLMAALRRRGLAVAPAKVGPDYIDPGYHLLAAGRPGRNLDPFLVGEDRIVPLLLHGALTPAPAEVAVIEGVMGLFDGRLGTDSFASTAHVARLTASPVVVCVDVRHQSATVGAVVHGLATYDDRIRVAGVVLNQVGSTRHEAEARRAIERTGIPVVGVLPRNSAIEAPSRHLGLVPAAERPESQEALDVLADLVAERVDVDAVLALARTAEPIAAVPWDPATQVRRPDGGDGRGDGGGGFARPVVAVAGGRAFTFRYAETAELLHAAGCEVVVFDPTSEAVLPTGTAGLYLGGGFPQVHATELAANAQLREGIRAAVAAGLPTVAECAGLLYLCRSVDGAPMAGALPLTAAMTPRLAMGYREATVPADTLLARVGERVRGHEFHRTRTTPTDDTGPPAWCLAGEPDGLSLDPAGTGRPTLHAAYLHVHWAGYPEAAQRFADAVHAYAGGTRAAGPAVSPDLAQHEDLTQREDLAHHGDLAQHEDLTHHGDKDIGPGLVDLAVNVRPARTPDFLVRAVVEHADWSAYPDAAPLRAALAEHHGVPAAHVLPTAGGAEAFTLIAHALHPTYPVVVHPQFTEPEAALRAAGHAVRRHLLTAAGDFRFEAAVFAAEHAAADLVVVGNPTNPTSVLHPRAELLRLVRPGRVLVVDEAFMDLVPGEPETLLGPGRAGPPDGVIVLRSLTKTWGIAGLRLGYAVGSPDLIARLAARQPPWAVSTPAIAAGLAALTPAAQDWARAQTARIAPAREDLLRRLSELGLRCVGPARAPYLLLDTSPLGAGSVRPDLAARGFAVRRGETFPGLGPTWIRLAVRDPDTHAALAAALAQLRPPTTKDRP